MRRGASSFIISLFAAQLLQATPEAAHKEAKQRKKTRAERVLEPAMTTPWSSKGCPPPAPPTTGPDTCVLELEALDDNDGDALELDVEDSEAVAEYDDVGVTCGTVRVRLQDGDALRDGLRVKLTSNVNA